MCTLPLRSYTRQFRFGPHFPAMLCSPLPFGRCSLLRRLTLVGTVDVSTTGLSRRFSYSLTWRTYFFGPRGRPGTAHASARRAVAYNTGQRRGWSEIVPARPPGAPAAAVPAQKPP